MTWLSWLKGTPDASRSASAGEAPRWRDLVRAMDKMSDRQSPRWKKGQEAANAWIRQAGEAGFRMLIEAYERGEEADRKTARWALKCMLLRDLEKPQGWDPPLVFSLAASRSDSLLWAVRKSDYDVLLPIVAEALEAHGNREPLPLELVDLLPAMRDVQDFGKKAERALPALRALAAGRHHRSEDFANRVRMIEESLGIAAPAVEATPAAGGAQGAGARRCASCGKSVRPFAMAGGAWSGTLAEAMALPSIEPDHAYICEKCGVAVCPVCSGRRASQLGVRAFVCTSCGHMPLGTIYRT